MWTYGSWRVEQTLGQGGMGVVLRVRHVQTGQPGALKTVATGGSSVRRALRREAAALRELDHPAIVRVLDDGTDEAEPWYVMELLEGRPLSAVLGPPTPVAAHTWPPSLSEAPGAVPSQPPIERPEPQGPVRYGLARLAELCHALCHLHAAGLVHCDLKPDNVMVVQSSDGDRAVLLDFGLVASRGPRTDRGSILADARVAGTAAYMSPERASGAPFDARADLYAVGCMLYKVLAGRPPFVGTPVEVKHAHRHAQPVPLSQVAPGVPESLGALVTELLHKDPRRRPGHAGRVLLELARLGVEVPSWPLPEAAPLYQPELQGRSAQLQALSQRVAALSAEGARGQALWISGESGSGKTRLVGALVARLGSRAPRMLVGGCSALQTASGPQPRGIPLELFSEPLREIAESAVRDPDLAHDIARPLALLRPWLPALPSLGAQEVPAEPLPDSAPAARHRLYTAVFEVIDAWFGGSSGPRVSPPAVLVLDDLQWADELSTGALAVLVRRLSERPWLLLGLRRSESEDAHLVPLLSQGEQLSLTRLSEEDVRAVVCDMLGQDESPRPLLGWVERHAAGNPLFVGECLRAAVADGVLTLDALGRWAFGEERAGELGQRPVPASLEQLMAARLQALSPLARTVVQAMAVLGRVAPLSLLCQVAALEPALVDRAVDELTLRAIAELRSDEEVATFVHDLLHERVYASMDPELRASLHGRAADALERSHLAEQRQPPDDAALGWHRERAGRPLAAAEAYGRAAEQAVARLALAEAEQRYQDALRLCAPIHERPLRMAWVRKVLLVQGRMAEAERQLLEVLSTLEPGDSLDRVEILLDLGRAVARSNRPQEALDWFEQARATALALQRLDLAHGASSEAGAVLARLGRVTEAVTLQEQAVAALGPEVSPSLRNGCQQRLATTYNMLGRNVEALALLDALVEAHARAGELAAEATARSSRANVLSFLGRQDEAIAENQAALAIQQRLGNRPSQGLLLGNWASSLVLQGRHAEAAVQYREALAVHRETGDLRNEGIVRLSLSNLLLMEARLEEVLEGVQAARRLLEGVGDLRWVAHCDKLTGQANRYLGQKEASREAMLRATEVYRAQSALVELSEILVHALFFAIAFDEPYDAPTGPLAELLAVTDGASPGTRLHRSRELAEHTVAMHRRGEPMLAGEDPEHLPEVLQRRVRSWSHRR